MSVFRPSARVQSPDGTSWEVYSYKIRLRDAETWGSDFAGDSAPWPYSGTGPDFALIDLIVWLLLLIPRLVVRLGEIAVAGVRAVRSDEWTVEAVAFVPSRTSYVWRTTREHKGQLLAQVEGSLARGDPPASLRNATYVGCSRSAR